MMRVEINSPLSSILALSTILKEFNSIQIIWDFRADKTFTARWLGGKVQV